MRPLKFAGFVVGTVVGAGGVVVLAAAVIYRQLVTPPWIGNPQPKDVH